MEKSAVKSNIQRFLFAHPFYNHCGHDESIMNVCVMGDTDYAQLFVDCALQTGQMADKKLQIFWCISETYVKEEYLAKRPALTEYVDTDGFSSDRGKTAYAKLSFMDNSEYLGEFAGDCRYAFVATGDDDKNLAMAELFKQTVKEDCIAAYICGNSIEAGFLGENDAPKTIEIAESGRKVTSDSELERMALNTYRIWEGEGNIDYYRMKRNFALENNHAAAVSFALSIPYKLRSLGIKDSDFGRGANKLRYMVEAAEKKSDASATKALERMAELERRRWLLEKATSGETDFAAEGPDYLAGGTTVEKLMTYIPFILTGIDEVCVCMPLGEAIRIKNNNDEFFKSVASATALYAKKIVFLFTPELNTNMSVLQSKLKAIRNYFEYRGSKCEIILQVLKDRDYEGNRDDSLKRVLKTSQAAGYINSYDIKQYDDAVHLIRLATEAVIESRADYYDGTTGLVESASINGQIVAAVSKVIPYFEFDSYNKQFENCVNCEFLNYARLSNFIKVEDMFALMNARDKECVPHDFEDVYMRFWDLYTGDGINERDFYLSARSWTKLCGLVSFGGIENMSISNRPIGASDPDEDRVIKKQLNALFGRGYIRNLYFGENTDTKGKRVSTASFKVIDKKLKGICAKTGDLLELYVYFECKKLGWFDDVQTGYKFRWEFDDVTNELDGVLTKGFRSILIECKSTKNPDEQFFLTLDSLGDHFGIGYKKVLIMVTDTEDRSYEGYMSRGKQMDIILISQKEELANIATLLKSIMERP